MTDIREAPVTKVAQLQGDNIINDPSEIHEAEIRATMAEERARRAETEAERLALEIERLTRERDHHSILREQYLAEADGMKEVLVAIAEGYPVHVADDRYVVVKNPDFTEGGRHDPNLVVDTRDMPRTGRPSRYLYERTDAVTGKTEEEVSKVDRTGEPGVSNVRPLYLRASP